MKNLFLFGSRTDFSDYFEMHMEKWFHIVEHFDTSTIPVLKDYYYKLSSVSLDRATWRDRYYSRISRYVKTPETFISRTSQFKRYLNALTEPVDVILQFSSLFNTTSEEKRPPHAVYTDYTTKMAIDARSDWAIFEDEGARDRWLELEAGLFRSTDLVMTFNPASRNSVITDYGIDKEKVVAVGSGSSITEVPVLDKDYDKKQILFCGRDFKRHGGELVVKAFPSVKKKFPDATLLIVGAVLTEEIDGVTCIDHLPLEALNKKMAESTVICMPSHIGGLQSMAEAMAYKCACVAAAGNPHIDNLVIDGETGLLLERMDADLLADALISLFTDRGLLERISVNGQEQVRKFFTWEGVCRVIHDNLMKIM